MFHRIKFLLLIVSGLSCNFSRLSVPFVFIVHEYRLQEYVTAALRVTLRDMTETYVAVAWDRAVPDDHAS